jgi:hypothetical protein
VAVQPRPPSRDLPRADGAPSVISAVALGTCQRIR